MANGRGRPAGDGGRAGAHAARHRLVTGDSDAMALAKRNQSWAHLVDEKHPFDKRPNTWVVRYGDQPWKQFLDMWATYVTVNGQVQRLYDEYIAKLT